MLKHVLFCVSPMCSVDRTRTDIVFIPNEVPQPLGYYAIYFAGPTGFEPAPHGVTSRHCKPFNHDPVYYNMSKNN